MKYIISKQFLANLNSILDKKVIQTAGILYKRLDVLTGNEINGLTNKQIKELFKALSKEILYEQNRVLKNKIRDLLIPSFEFKNNNPTDK